MVARLVSSAFAIWLSLHASPASARVGLQQDAGLHQPLCGVFAAMDHAIQPLPLFRAELHDILLYGDLFGGHELAPSLRYGAIDLDILLTVNDGRYLAPNGSSAAGSRLDDRPTVRPHLRLVPYYEFVVCESAS